MVIGRETVSLTVGPCDLSSEPRRFVLFDAAAFFQPQIGANLIRPQRLILSNIKSTLMKQKADSQEKQNANKTGQYRSRSISAHPGVPTRFQPMLLEPCLNSAATYDPNFNYAIVLASLLLLLDTHDAERGGRPE